MHKYEISQIRYELNRTASRSEIFETNYLELEERFLKTYKMLLQISNLAKMYQTQIDVANAKIIELETFSHPIRVQETRMLTVSAYNAHVDQCDDTPFITATGTRVRPGIVAVSPDMLEKGWTYGSLVAINDHVYRIEDVMNSRYTDTMDIFMWSEEDAKAWGRRQIQVSLLRN